MCILNFHNALTRATQFVCTHRCSYETVYFKKIMIWCYKKRLNDKNSQRQTKENKQNNETKKNNPKTQQTKTPHKTKRNIFCYQLPIPPKQGIWTSCPSAVWRVILKLRTVPGSICWRTSALKERCRFPGVRTGMGRADAL